MKRCLLLLTASIFLFASPVFAQFWGPSFGGPGPVVAGGVTQGFAEVQVNSFGFGFGQQVWGGSFMQPAPVFIQPTPVFIQPTPICVQQPMPVFVQPAPVFVQPAWRHWCH